MKPKTATPQSDEPRDHKHLSQKSTPIFRTTGRSSYFKAYCNTVNSLSDVLSNHHMWRLGQKNEAHTERTERKFTIYVPRPCPHPQTGRAGVYAMFSKAGTLQSASRCEQAKPLRSKGLSWERTAVSLFPFNSHCALLHRRLLQGTGKALKASNEF